MKTSEVREMNIRSCYEKMGADFDEVSTRLVSEALITKIAKKYIDDPSFSQLKDAFEKKDIETAFRASHTLKGVCLNVGFTQLTKDVIPLTEILRGQSWDGAQELFDQVEESQKKTIKLLKELD